MSLIFSTVVIWIFIGCKEFRLCFPSRRRQLDLTLSFLKETESSCFCNGKWPNYIKKNITRWGKRKIIKYSKPIIRWGKWKIINLNPLISTRWKNIWKWPLNLIVGSISTLRLCEIGHLKTWNIKSAYCLSRNFYWEFGHISGMGMSISLLIVFFILVSCLLAAML